MKIEPLESYPQLYPQVAAWIYEAFPYEFAHTSFAEWLDYLKANNHSRHTQSFVLLQDQQPIATASLDGSDFPGKEHLSPWLASVYTLPHFRGQGLAAKLMQHIEHTAKTQGHTQLYLHTTDQMAFYAKRGWRELEQVSLWGRQSTLMVKQL